MKDTRDNYARCQDKYAEDEPPYCETEQTTVFRSICDRSDEVACRLEIASRRIKDIRRGLAYLYPEEESLKEPGKLATSSDSIQARLEQALGDQEHALNDIFRILEELEGIV